MKPRILIMTVITLLALTAVGEDISSMGLFGSLVKANFSIADLEKDAQSGNPDAQCALGFCYMTGLNTPGDFNKGIEWIDKAAQQGYQFAMGMMGMFYMEGDDSDLAERDSLGIKLQPDNKKACDYFRQLPVRTTDYMSEMKRTITWVWPIGPSNFFSVPWGKDEKEYLKELEQEASTGNATAQYQLACYYLGYTTEWDGLDEADLEAAQKAHKEKEMYWLRRAAEQGHAAAQVQLGVNLKEDEQSPLEAMQWFKAAADQGDIGGMKNLALCYITSETPDTAQAVTLYRQAAECGDEDAQFFLANCYYLGKGVPQNYAEAFKLYQMLTLRQDNDPIFRLTNVYELLGDCYLYGHGVEKDLDKALECYQKVEKDCFDSFAYPYYQMGLYYEGKNQESKALEYYKQAADNLNLNAAAKLAGYYYDGSHGMPQDYSQAAKYYSMNISPMPDTTGWFRTIKNSIIYPFDNDTTDTIAMLPDSVELDTIAPEVEVVEEVADEDNLFDMERYADRDFYKQAMSGDAQAQLRLGKMLMQGDTTFLCSINRELAAQWLEKAALQGNAEAQYLLAQCYENNLDHMGGAEYVDDETGEYVVSDEVEKMIAQNQEKAMQWYLKAAQNGIPKAQLEVATRYYLDNNEKAALEWYLKAAQAGLPDAQNKLGDLYRDGELVKQNYSEAVKWYKKAAGQDNLQSCEALGNCYIEGTGVAKDASQGIYWLERAARGGDTSVATMLGDMYAQGESVAQDYKKAIYWYTIGASDSNTARNSLGELYRDGKGTAKNYKKAVYWFRCAAEDDCTEAQLNLSECYRNGWGVTKSTSQAKYWENKAKEETIDIIHDVEF